jgi:hypothetical protein
MATTPSTDDDMNRAIDAMRESVIDIRKKDYCGALMQVELAALLVRIAASKQPKTESR